MAENEKNIVDKVLAENEKFKHRGLYRFKGTPEKLVYRGYNWSGNGFWHQFELEEKPGAVWAEITASDTHMIEERK